MRKRQVVKGDIGFRLAGVVNLSAKIYVKQAQPSYYKPAVTIR
jgi:hypothetical protein